MIREHWHIVWVRWLTISLAALLIVWLVALAGSQTVDLGASVYRWFSESSQAEERLVAGRANIVVKPGWVFHTDGRGSLQGYVSLKTAGERDTKIHEWAFGVEVLDSDTLLTALYDFKNLEPEPGAPTFPPGKPIVKYRQLGSLTNEEVSGLILRKKRVYVYGTIVYEDSRLGKYLMVFCRMYSGPEHTPWPLYPDIEAYAEGQMNYCPGEGLNFTRRLDEKSLPKRPRRLPR